MNDSEEPRRPGVRVPRPNRSRTDARTTPGLGTTRTTFSPQVRGGVEDAAARLVRVGRRGDRYRLREALRRVTVIARQARCASQVVSTLGLVEVVKAGPVAHFRGVGVCGLVHTCPVCSPKIRQGRALEIAEAARAALARGWSVEFLTLTMRHHRGDRLGDLLVRSSGAWTSMLKSRQLSRLLDELGYRGLVQVHEFTYGDGREGRRPNGWHPHRHACLFFDRTLTDRQRLDLEAEIMKVWKGRLNQRGLTAVEGVGADLRRCTVAEGLAWYLTKVERADGHGTSSLGLEMARGDLKSGKGLRPDQLLSIFVETGEATYRHLWREYEEATAGRKLMTWSPGLKRELLGVRPELTDEELAEAAPVGAEVLAELDVVAWREVRAASPGGLALLEAAEEGRADLLLYLQRVVSQGRWWVGKDGWLEAG